MLIDKPIKQAPRSRTFDFSGQPLGRWLDDDAVATQFYNAFFVIIPAYERLVVTVVARSAKEIRDRKFAAEIRGFLVEEGAHSREHGRFNRELVRSGYRAVKRIDRFHQGVVDYSLKIHSLAFLRAVSAVGELMTAAMCAEYLRMRTVAPGHSRSTVDEFWTWHCVEEVEHGHLCLDVFQALSRSERKARVLYGLGLVLGVPFFQLSILLNHIFLLGKDGVLWRWSTIKSLIRFWIRHLAQLARVLSSLSPISKMHDTMAVQA